MTSGVSESALHVAVELMGGAWCVLQRLSTGSSAELFRQHLSEELGAPVLAVEELEFSQEPGPVRLFDARQLDAEGFVDWDAQRTSLAGAERPLVVLLNVQSGMALLRTAPQTASWAGGVRMPAEAHVRAAESEPEVAMGRRALRERLAEDPSLAAKLRGLTFAVELSSGRIFTPSPDSVALLVAQESLDQGVVWVTRLVDEGPS